MSSLAQKAKLKRKRSNADDGSSSTLPLPSHRARRTYQAANAVANPVGAADFDADTIPAGRGMPAAQRPTSTLKKTLASGTPVANRGTTVATAVHGSKLGSSAALAISLSDDDDYSGANGSGRAQANGLPNESLPQQRSKALEVTMDTTVPTDNAYLSRGSLRRGQADLSKPGLSGFAQTHAGSALTSYTPTPSYSAIVHSFSTFVHSNRSARSPAFGSSVQNSNRRRSPSSDMGNGMQDMDIDPESPVASPAAHRNLNAGGKPAVAILPPSSPPVTSRQYTAAHSPAAASLAPPMPPDARSPSLEDGEISMEDGEIADEREPSPPRSFVPQPAPVPAPAPRKKARTRAPAFQYQQSAPTSSPYAARPPSPPSRYPYPPAASYPPPPPPRYDYPPPPPPPPQWGPASSDQPPPALGPPSTYAFEHPPYPPATPAYPFASGYPPPPPGSVPFQPPPPPDAPPPAPPPPPSLPNPEFMPFMPVDDFDYAGMLAPPSHPPRPGKLSKKEKKLAKAAKAASEGLSKKQKKNAKKLQNQNVLLAAPDPTLHAYAHGWPIANQGPGPQAIALDVQSQRDACKYETFDVHEAKHVLSDLLAWEYQLDHITELGLVPEVAVRALRELRPDMVLPDFLKDVDDGEAALLAVQKVLRARNTNIAGNDGYGPPPPHPLVQSSPAGPSTTSAPEVAQFGTVHQAFLAQTAPIAESAPAASLPQASVAQPQAGSSRVPDKSRELEQSMEELRARIAVLESMKAKKKQKAAAAAVAAPPARSEDVAMAEATPAAATSEAEPATNVVLPRAILAPLATDVRSQEAPASPQSASGSSVAPATAMDVDPDEITSFLKNIPLPAPTTASQGVSRSRSRTPLSASDLPGPRPAKRFRPVAADFEEAPPAPPVLKRATTSFARLDLVVHSCVIDISDDEEDLHSSAQAGPSRTAAAQSKPVVALTSQELEIAQLKARIAAAERKRQLAKQSKVSRMAGCYWADGGHGQASGSGAATPA